MIDLAKLHWAAGFFEGEGAVRLNKGSQQHFSWTMGYQVINCDRDTLVMFKEGVAGIGKILGPYGPYGVSKKPTYCWLANKHADVVALTGLLFPLLSPRRQGQILHTANEVRKSKTRRYDAR